MRLEIVLLLSLICAGRFAIGQITVTPSDTIICPDTEVILNAEYDHCLLTECYFGEEIVFDWITDPGTPADLDDNDHDGPFPIGFDFCFFGEVYNEFWVCDNGWISFSPPSNAMSDNSFPDGPIPSAAATVPKNAIFASWRDMFASGGTSSVQYFTTGIPGFRRTFIKFAEMEHPYCDDSITSYFEIALHESENYIDNIFFQVELCDGEEELSILGLQNNSGTVGYMAPGKDYTEWDAIDYSYRWKPNDVRWILDGDTVAYGPVMSFFPAVSTDVIAMINGCDGTVYTDTVHIEIPGYFDPEIEVIDNICYGENNGSIDITFPAGSSGYEINWSTGETNEDLENLESGYYILTITDENGCENEFSIYVDEPSEFVVSPVGVTDETCIGAGDGTITVSAFGGLLPYEYSLNGGDFEETNFFNGLSAGEYTIVAMDANGCTYGAIFTIDIGTIISTDITAVSPIYEGQSTTITVTADGEITSIDWTPDGIIDPCPDEPCSEYTATLTETTTFLAAIASSTGCIAYDSVTVIVIPINALIFPTAFSPNNDGSNDLFQTVSNYYIADFHLSIYNRYGQILFETKNPAFTSGWDGIFENQEQPIGTYLWSVTVTFENGLSWNGAGNFILVR